MYALYELSLLVAARVERRRKAREEA
jgi:Sec-independent protein secretion pathway component TatC